MADKNQTPTGFEVAPIDYRKLTTGELLKGGFERGLEGLKGTAFDLIPALAASSLGYDEFAKQQMQDYQARMAAVEQAHPTAYKELSDIKGIGDILPFAAETAGQLAPDALSFIGGAGIGTTAGKLLAKKGAEKALEKYALDYAAQKGLTGEAATTAADAFKSRAIGQSVIKNAAEHGAKVGTNIGITGASFGLNVPDVLQSVYEDTGELHPGIALTMGSLVSMLDTVLPQRLLSQLGNKGKAQLATELLEKSTIVPTTWKKAFATQVAKDVGLESLTEGTQQALQVAASQMAGDKKDFFDPKNIDNIIMASVQGAIGGFTGGALPSAMEARNIKAQSQLDAERQKQLRADQELIQQEQTTAPATTIGQAPLTPEQIREQKQLAAAQQIHGDLFGQPVPQRPTNTFPVGQEETQIPATLAPPTGELNLQGAPVQGELDLRPAETTPAQAQNTVLDADTLKGTGLKTQSGFFRQLVGKDMANPEDQKAIGEVLARVRSNPNLTPETKKAVETIAMNAFNALATQQEMFGPRGGVLKGADNGRVQPRTNVETDRTSPEVPVEQVPTESTEGAGEPEQRGMAPTAEPVSELGAREEVQPDTLVPEETPSETETTEKTEPTEAPVETAPAKEVPAQTFANRPEDLKTLQDHIEQLKEDFRLAQDPETKQAIRDEIKATQSDIDNKQYQQGKLTDKFVGNKDALFNSLRKRLNQIGLSGIPLRLVDFGEGVTGLGQYTGKTNDFIKSIQVSLGNRDEKEFLNTLNHESIHAFRNLNVFTPREWSTLERMADKEWIKKYDIENRYKDQNLSKEQMREEAIAEAFADYAGQEKPIQNIIDKVINFFKALGNALRGRGFNTAESIFESIDTGKREPQKGKWYKTQEEFDKFFRDYNLDDEGQAQYQMAVKKGKDFANIVGDLVESVPYISEEQKNAWSAAVSNTKDNASSAALSFAPLHALTDMAKDAFGKLAPMLNRLVDQKSGFEHSLTRGVEGAKEILRHALEVAPQQKTPYNKLVNSSTIAEVDPTKPRDYYKNQETRDNRSKQEVWDELNKQYNQLAPAWKRSYSVMRDAYKQMFEEIKKAIKSRIEATELGKETKELVYKDIMESLTKSGVIEPYFSLGREGEHWLASNFIDKNGQKEFEVRAFKSPREREMRQKEILAMDPNARSDMYRQVSDIDYRRAPPSSFINNALRIMEINKVPTDAIEEMMRLFVATLPETALAQSFQRRSGRAGYMEDSIAVFEKKMRGMAHQITNMVYTPKFDNILDRMRLHTYQVGKGIAAGEIDAFGNQVKEDIKGRNNVEQSRYLDEFEKRIGYIKNPSRDNFGNVLQSAAFIYTMGFNPSSAIVQTANIPMIVMPSLKAAYPNANITKTIGDAVKIFMGSGTTAQTNVLGSIDETTGKPVTVGMKVRQSIANYQPNSAIGKEYEIFVRTLNENGQLNRSQLGEILQGDINGNIWQKFKSMSGWMLHHTERMNREVTMIATYKLEMERLKKPNAQDVAGIEEARKEAELRYDRPVSTEEATQIYATNKAIDVNEMTNGNISSASAPRIAQSALGKIGFMYKRYAISMYYMLFKAYRDATKGESPEIRAAGLRQLGGVLGMTALMAGAQGLPMFGALSVLYNLFRDNDEDDLKGATEKTIGDLLYKGPIEYMTNLSIASRIGLSDLLIRDTTTASSTNTFSQQVMQALGGPVLGVEQNFERGFSKIAQGHFERGVEDLLPSAIANTFKAYRYATQGTETLRGDPITGDVSTGNVLAQALGFAPSNYIKQMEINDREKGIDKSISDRQSKFKQRYYIARREGDVDGMLDMRDKLLELGQKHPEIGINGGNINDILATSIKAQDRATKEMIAGVRYNKKRLKVIQQDMEDY